MPTNQKHLGDGLYVSYDGYQIAISVNSHLNEPVAYLNPNVMDEMANYIREINQLEFKNLRHR